MTRARYDLRLEPETALEKRVARMLRAGSDGDSLRAHVRDVCNHGCQSGVVSELIYTRDCVRFFLRYRSDIETLVSSMCDDMGVDGPAGLFGDKWETSDPFARDDANRNLLAWFGFEETARSLASRAGYDL